MGFIIIGVEMKDKQLQFASQMCFTCCNYKPTCSQWARFCRTGWRCKQWHRSNSSIQRIFVSDDIPKGMWSKIGRLCAFTCMRQFCRAITTDSNIRTQIYGRNGGKCGLYTKPISKEIFEFNYIQKNVEWEVALHCTHACVRNARICGGFERQKNKFYVKTTKCIYANVFGNK